MELGPGLTVTSNKPPKKGRLLKEKREHLLVSIRHQLECTREIFSNEITFN